MRWSGRSGTLTGKPRARSGRGPWLTLASGGADFLVVALLRPRENWGDRSSLTARPPRMPTLALIERENIGLGCSRRLGPSAVHARGASARPVHGQARTADARRGIVTRQGGDPFSGAPGGAADYSPVPPHTAGRPSHLLHRTRSMHRMRYRRYIQRECVG